MTFLMTYTGEPRMSATCSFLEIAIRKEAVETVSNPVVERQSYLYTPSQLDGPAMPEHSSASASLLSTIPLLIAIPWRL